MVRVVGETDKQKQAIGGEYAYTKGTVYNQPGLTSQRHSALISSDSEYFQVCFSAVHYLRISEQRWFSSEQRWKRKFSELKISAETALFSSETELIQSWTAMIFSETALKLETRLIFNISSEWPTANSSCLQKFKPSTTQSYMIYQSNLRWKHVGRLMRSTTIFITCVGIYEENKNACGSKMFFVKSYAVIHWPKRKLLQTVQKTQVSLR